MRPRPTRFTIAAAAILVCVLFAATAAAVVTKSQGKAQLGMLNRGGDTATTKSTTGWTALPGATGSVTVPAGAVINARFTAQSLCQSAGTSTLAGICSVRIRAGGIELKPLVPTAMTSAAFAFDSHGPGGKGGNESHAVERSIKVPATGTYTVGVEVNVSAATAFILNYWHLAVETSAP